MTRAVLAVALFRDAIYVPGLIPAMGAETKIRYWRFYHHRAFRTTPIFPHSTFFG
jgi:hypothetical protein